MKDGRISHIYEILHTLKFNITTVDNDYIFGVCIKTITRFVIVESRKCSMLTEQNLCNLTFSHDLRINGWRQKHIELLRKEAFHRVGACVWHLTEDIQRHSTLDNYWCFVYERTIHFHNMQTTNQKQICKTDPLQPHLLPSSATIASQPCW